MTMRGMVVPMILAVAGFSIGWMRVEQKGESVAQVAAAEPVEKRSGARLSVAELANSMKKRRTDSQKLGYNPLKEKLRDWTDHEVIDALNASLTDPEVMLRSGAGDGLATQLWAEWMRRDFDAAIAWFDSIKSLTVRLSVIGDIPNLWPPDRMEEGIRFVLDHREMGIDGTFRQIFASAIGERAGQGVESLESLLKMMREEKIKFYLSLPIPFPNNFDFKKLVAGDEFRKMWDRGEATMVIRGWSERDRDSAFDWLLENHGQEKLAMLVPGKDHYQDHERWLGSRIAALDAAERDAYFESHRLTWLGWGADSLVKFSEGVEDPVFLDKLRTLGVQSIYGGGTHKVMPMLEAMADPESRIQLLESVPWPGEESRGYLNHPFNEVDEALLREKLAAWDASPERIDAIITRFKKKP